MFVTQMKPWEIGSLIKICDLFNAVKCKHALQKLKSVSEVDVDEMLTSLLNYTYYFGTVSSDLNDHFILHLNCILRKKLDTAAGSNHLTSEEVALVKRAVNNLTCVLDRNLVARVLLDSLIIILQAKAQNESAVPQEAIDFLVYSSHLVAPFFYDDEEEEEEDLDDDDDENDDGEGFYDAAAAAAADDDDNEQNADEDNDDEGFCDNDGGNEKNIFAVNAENDKILY